MDSVNTLQQINSGNSYNSVSINNRMGIIHQIKQPFYDYNPNYKENNTIDTYNLRQYDNFNQCNPNNQ